MCRPHCQCCTGDMVGHRTITFVSPALQIRDRYQSPLFATLCRQYTYRTYGIITNKILIPVSERTYIKCRVPCHDPSDYARYVYMHGVGDEKHLVFECSALNGIRLRFPHLFKGFHTMSSFMNQAAQRVVMHFITDCLRTQP